MEAEITELRVGLEHHRMRRESGNVFSTASESVQGSGGIRHPPTPSRARLAGAAESRGASQPTVMSLVSRLGETNQALQARLAAMHAQRTLMTPCQTPSRGSCSRTITRRPESELRAIGCLGSTPRPFAV